jgi:hypothetical protein
MNQEHPYRPSEEFRARLEQQVLRRHGQRPAGNGISSGANLPRTRLAASVAISLVLGAIAGFASAQVGRSAERDSLLAAARAQAALADAQRDLAQAVVREVEEKVRTGVARFEDLYQASADLAGAERRRSLLGLDIEEISATGASPRDDLNAPVVNGRDFVKLRIEANVAGTQARLQTAEKVARMIDAQIRSGVAPTVTGAAAAADVAAVQAELAVLAEKLALRSEFLKSGTSIEELTRRLHAAQLRQDANALQQRLRAARARLDTVKQQRSLGVVSEVELLRATLDVKELELSLQNTQELSRARP